MPMFKISKSFRNKILITALEVFNFRLNYLGSTDNIKFMRSRDSKNYYAENIDILTISALNKQPRTEFIPSLHDTLVCNGFRFIMFTTTPEDLYSINVVPLISVKLQQYADPLTSEYHIWIHSYWFKSLADALVVSLLLSKSMPVYRIGNSYQIKKKYNLLTNRYSSSIIRENFKRNHDKRSKRSKTGNNSS